jgi:hypothetical protein
MTTPSTSQVPIKATRVSLSPDEISQATFSSPAEKTAAEAAQQDLEAKEKAFATAQQAYLDSRKKLSDTLETSGMHLDTSGQLIGEQRGPTKYLDPTLDELVEYQVKKGIRTKGTDVSKQFSTKILAKVPKFKGEPSDSWADFEFNVQMAALNAGYNENEMLQVTLQALEGLALRYVTSRPELLEMKYGQFLAEMRKRYTETEEQAITRLQAVVQMPKEKVQDFGARLRATARPLKPNKPPVVRIEVRADGSRFSVANPTYSQEVQIYSTQVKTVEKMLVTYFIQGLLPEIFAKMTTAKYEHLDAAIDAAVDAEYLIETTKVTYQVNRMHLEGSSNAISGQQGYGQGQREKRQDFRRCFNCQEVGHLKRNCKKPRQGQQGQQGRYTGGYNNHFVAEKSYNSVRGRSKSPMNRNRSGSGNRAGWSSNDLAYVNSLREKMQRSLSNNKGSADGRRGRSKSPGNKKARFQFQGKVHSMEGDQDNTMDYEEESESKNEY